MKEQHDTAQAASSAVLKAIREANMQLVRTGDNAFMLVPYKVATAQSAESVLAPVLDSLLNIVINHEALATPAEVRSMAAELATYRAARAPAESVGRDAERWRTFIGLPYEIRAEWATNLSLVPVLTQWVDQAAIDSAMAANGGNK